MAGTWPVDGEDNMNIDNDYIINAICENKIIAIIRGIGKEKILKTAEALLKGGLNIMEVTLNRDDAFDCIKLVESEFQNRVIIGAGTVLTQEQVEKSYDAGAKFIVSPNIDEQVIAAAKKANMVSIPGALTPSEIYRAHVSGADFVKVFPAGSLGPEYIKAVLAPLQNIPLLAVGGVDLNNMNEYLHMGAVGVGIGGNLVSKSLINAGEFDRLSELAGLYVEKIKEG
jgi:2-dehydro-3-deoxyphosphogluconate aldolase/(4S)-4-hydroxy-2-oxoglutarate aldolase